jgi:hypothetical protein
VSKRVRYVVSVSVEEWNDMGYFDSDADEILEFKTEHLNVERLAEKIIDNSRGARYEAEAAERLAAEAAPSIVVSEAAK